MTIENVLEITYLGGFGVEISRHAIGDEYKFKNKG